MTLLGTSWKSPKHKAPNPKIEARSSKFGNQKPPHTVGCSIPTSGSEDVQLMGRSNGPVFHAAQPPTARSPFTSRHAALGQSSKGPIDQEGHNKGEGTKQPGSLF